MGEQSTGGDDGAEATGLLLHAIADLGLVTCFGGSGLLLSGP